MNFFISKSFESSFTYDDFDLNTCERKKLIFVIFNVLFSVSILREIQLLIQRCVFFSTSL